MNGTIRIAQRLLRLLSIVLLAGAGAQAWAGSADIEGRVAFTIDGDRITVEIDRIANNTSDTTTGTLYVTVWMTASPDIFSTGYRVARHRITGSSNGQLEPGQYFSDIRWTLDYQAPPPGTYYIHFFTSQHPEPDTVLDSRTFTSTVQVAQRGGSGPADIEGWVEFSISGDHITVEIERIANNTSGTTTGTLYVTVQMTASSSLFSSGYQVARHQITGSTNGQLEPGQYFSDIRWTLDYQAPPSGTYYVHFYTSQHPEPNTVLDYRTFSNTLNVGGSGGGGADDHGDSRSDATNVAVPGEVSGRIDPTDDEDWFRLDLTRAGTVEVRASVTSGDLDVAASLADLDYYGVGDSGLVFSQRLDAGVHYLVIRHDDIDGDGIGNYAIELDFEAEDGGSDRPDLVVGSLSASVRHVAPSAPFILASTVRNRGNARSPASTVGYYREGNGGIRTILGEQSLPTLDPSATQAAELRLNAEATAGTYTYIACVASVAGESDTSNNCSSSVSVVVQEQASTGVFADGQRALGDFDGDGRADVLLRHTDGRWFFYPMDGRRHMSGEGTANLTRNLEWAVAGVGDLNGDGRDDVLLRKPTTGTWYYYPMNGRRHLAGHGAANLPSDLAWTLAGIGDFDGNGRDDVLLRHAEGHWHFYPMNGRHYAAGQGRTNMTRNLQWSVAGVGDLDGDGSDDVLLRKPATGTWYYYPMNGRRHLAGHGAANLPSDLAWSLAGIGDFDGNGRDDVLLRHAEGHWHFYPMNGRRYAAGQGRTNMTRNLQWSVAGVGDLDGDGSDDVLMRKPTTGTWYYYPMNGRRHLAGHGAANLTSNLDWGLTTAGSGSGGSTGGGSSIAGVPTVKDEIERQSLTLGDDIELDLSGAFSDDQDLTYEIRSSNADVVRVSVSGSKVSLMPVAEGTATVTVTARDADGNEATTSFAVLVAGNGGGTGSGQAPGESFRDCDTCPPMVSVAAGSFSMGAPASEAFSKDDERPQRTVSIPAFAASAYEVTFAEWDACVADGGCGDYRPNDGGMGRGGRPVINVSWNDAQLYVQWLSRKTGQTYRLPTEAEWEYAARAGTTTPFHTGGTISPQQANYNGKESYPSGNYNEGGLYRGQTVPVGSFAPNGFGLYDVHGNVWEWVQDCHGSYANASTNGSAVELDNCFNRVARGGSWPDGPSVIRSANRAGGGGSGGRSSNSGFRVVRTLAP